MIHVIVILSVRDREKLTEFESKAIEIMARHEGRLVVAFTSSDDSGEKEIHHLEFPSIESLQNYRTDLDLLALSSLREQGISESQVLISDQVLDYNT